MSMYYNYLFILSFQSFRQYRTSSVVVPVSFMIPTEMAPATVPRAAPPTPPAIIALPPIGSLYMAPASRPPALYSNTVDLFLYVDTADVKNL